MGNKIKYGIRKKTKRAQARKNFLRRQRLLREQQEQEQEMTKRKKIEEQQQEIIEIKPNIHLLDCPINQERLIESPPIIKEEIDIKMEEAEDDSSVSNQEKEIAKTFQLLDLVKQRFEQFDKNAKRRQLVVKHVEKFINIHIPLYRRKTKRNDRSKIDNTNSIEIEPCRNNSDNLEQVLINPNEKLDENISESIESIADPLNFDSNSSSTSNQDNSETIKENARLITQPVKIIFHQKEIAKGFHLLERAKEYFKLFDENSERRQSIVNSLEEVINKYSPMYINSTIQQIKVPLSNSNQPIAIKNFVESMQTSNKL